MEFVWELEHLKSYLAMQRLSGLSVNNILMLKMFLA